jgi:hypothetical protein
VRKWNPWKWDRYETSVELSKIGVISGYDMTIEAASQKIDVSVRPL